MEMMEKQQIRIGKRRVGANAPVFIIAEAGVNHNGDIKLAKKMVDAAKAAGADAIKFQTYRAEELVTKEAPKAEYQKKTAKNKTQYEMLKELELSEGEFKYLSAYCKKMKILFLSTPFDPKSALFLRNIKIPVFKISSGEITNVPLLTQIAAYGRPIILSTGMATVTEVKTAVRAIYQAGNRDIILLHCTSNYPTRYEDVNLKAMLTIKKEFGLPVGYSDHTNGIEVAVAAVAMGATVIEKHFTLNKKMPGPDHQASLDPDELAQMVLAIRHIELALGNGVKGPRATEKEVRAVIRKSVVAAIDIPKGVKLQVGMLTLKRPGTGIAPKDLPKLLNKRVKRNISPDTLITWEMLG